MRQPSLVPFTLRQLATVLAVAAAFSTATLIALGFRPVVPADFVQRLILLVPVGWLLATVLTRAETLVAPRYVPLLGVTIAGALLASTQTSELMLGLMCVPLLVAVRPSRPERHTGLGLVTLTYGYTALWGLNYLALAAVRNRLGDPAARYSDEWIYALLGHHRIDYRGLFPLVTNPLLLAPIQAAYILFFLELSMLLWLLTRAQLTTYLTRLFACYATALVVFLVWPVTGPSLAYPEAIRTDIGGPAAEIMQTAHAEYAAVLSGLPPPTTILGYFVGMPSLHVAAAWLFQWTLRTRRLAFWTFLPINVLMAVSTFVLGFHYLIDSIGGLALGAFVVRSVREREG